MPVNTKFNPEDLGQQGRLVLFLFLQILGGHVGIPLVLLTILLSRRIMRHPIFVNFCATWFLYSLSYTLLFYARQENNAHPNFALCVTQAAMVYGAPPMIGVSVFVFVLHLFLVIRGAVYPNPALRWQKLRLVAMLTAPYLVYLIVFTVAIIIGNSNPYRVHRSTFYCTIKLQAVTNLAAGVSAAGVIAAIFVQALTAITLRRHWRAFRDAAKSGVSLSLLIRALVFTFCSVLALLTCMAFLAELTSPAPNFVLACLPMAAFLVFGTQSDLLHVWCFWRKGEKPVPELAYPPVVKKV